MAAVLKKEGVSAEVRKWLEAWHGCKVPLDTARERWCEAMVKSQAWIANLLRKDDRIAGCSYAISGDVIPTPSGAPKTAPKVTCGSVVMFSHCLGGKKGSQSEKDVNFLFTFLPVALAQQRLQGSSFIAAGAVLARRRVECLARALKDNHVSIEV